MVLRKYKIVGFIEFYYTWTIFTNVDTRYGQKLIT